MPFVRPATPCPAPRFSRAGLLPGALLLLTIGALSSTPAAQDPAQPTDEELRKQLLQEMEQARARQRRLDQIDTARAHLAAKRFAPAAALLADLIRLEPAAPLYLDLGQAQIGLQDFPAARASFKRTLDLRATPGGEAAQQPAQRGLGWLAYRDADYVEALHWWEPLLAAGQRDGNLLDLCGRAYYYTQQREAALRCFDAAQLGRPGDRELIRWRIFCAHDTGDYAQADRLSRAYLAQRRITAAGTTTAEPAADPAATAAVDADIRRIAAQCAAALHRNDDAILQLERLNLDTPLNPADWQLLGTLYSDRQADARAAECFEAACPPGADGQGRAKLSPDDWLRLAQLHERAGNRANAGEYYRQVKADSPPFAFAALGLARLAQLDQKPEQVLEHARAALEARPDLADAHLLLAETFERLNKPTEATAAYQQAAATPECAATAYLGLGRIAYEQKQWAAALRYYQSAAPLRPDDPTIAKIIVQLQDQIAAAASELPPTDR